MRIVTLLLVISASAQAAPVAVHGHRGARAVLPENTLPAMEHALSVGVDYLELDLVVSRDNVLVLSHNLKFEPWLCTQGDGTPLKEPISARSLRAKEIGKLDCGRLKNKRFPRQETQPGTPPPTLEQVFEWVAASKHGSARTVQFNIETKTVPVAVGELTPTPAEFAELVVKVVQKHKLEKRVVVQSFDHQVLRAVAERAPTIRRAALVAESRPNYVAVAKAARAQIISPNHHWIDADDVKAMHAAGIEVHPWTANSPTDWDRLLKLGVDGIITDDPRALMRHLRRTKR